MSSSEKSAHENPNRKRNRQKRQTMSIYPIRFWVMSPRDADNIAVGMCPFRPLSVLTASVLKVRVGFWKGLYKFQATRDMIDHATIQWSSGENSSAEFNAVLDGVLEVCYSSFFTLLQLVNVCLF